VQRNAADVHRLAGRGPECDGAVREAERVSRRVALPAVDGRAA
jgi:hypothetical protein